MQRDQRFSHIPQATHGNTIRHPIKDLSVLSTSQALNHRTEPSCATESAAFRIRTTDYARDPVQPLRPRALKLVQEHFRRTPAALSEPVRCLFRFLPSSTVSP